MASIREDLDKERKQLEAELEEVLEEVNVLEEQDKLLHETICLLTKEKLTMEEELKNARAELERWALAEGKQACRNHWMITG